MTVAEAIARADGLRQSPLTMSEKVRRLSELDGKIKAEIIDKHEGGEGVTFEPYTNDTMNRTLIVPFPYDELYVYYLDMHACYVMGEMERYTNAMTMFNTAYRSFSCQYVRTHMPLQAKKRML